MRPGKRHIKLSSNRKNCGASIHVCLIHREFFPLSHYRSPDLPDISVLGIRCAHCIAHKPQVLARKLHCSCRHQKLVQYSIAPSLPVDSILYTGLHEAHTLAKMHNRVRHGATAHHQVLEGGIADACDWSFVWFSLSTFSDPIAQCLTKFSAKLLAVL